MRFLGADLLAQRGLTAYRLAAQSGGRIAQRTAYRIAKGEKQALDPDEMAALCDVLGVTPADLFEYRPRKAG